MDREAIIQKFERLRVWRNAGERAPHKPLLVLYAIGELLRDGNHLLPYSEIDENLGNLLRELGGNEISDLSPLADLTDLTSLILDVNRVSDLSPLIGLINLREISVQSNPLNPKTIAVDVPVLEAAGVDVNHSYQ